MPGLDFAPWCVAAVTRPTRKNNQRKVKKMMKMSQRKVKKWAQEKPHYVLQWEDRGIMASKFWQKVPGWKKWEKLLMNMPASAYEKLFPDAYRWVKKFATRKNMKMHQVCKRMDYVGKKCKPQDFSMWACLFADKAFTGMSQEELNDLIPDMKVVLLEYHRKNNMWPHPGVLLAEVRRHKKERLENLKVELKRKRDEVEEDRVTTKKRKTESKMRGKKVSPYHNVFWHDQSDCWRALVKKVRSGKKWKYVYEHFPEDRLKEAARASSKGLKIPWPDMLKETSEQRKNNMKAASRYEGVFYDARAAYKKKWMAVVWVRKGREGNYIYVWKGLGHFTTQLQAAEAVAGYKKCTIKDRTYQKGIETSDHTIVSIPDHHEYVYVYVYIYDKHECVISKLAMHAWCQNFCSKARKPPQTKTACLKWKCA